MARAKKKEAANEMSDLYRSLQLTPEEKAAARQRLEAQSEEAARNHVYEQFMALRIGECPRECAGVDRLNQSRLTLV